MNRFTIKDIENLSGIKAHTWRIWEQRYGIASPQRKNSNHRFYDNENLKQILRISYLYHRGFKISKIASFNEQEIRNKAGENIRPENGYQFYIKELLEASIDLDEEKFEQTFNEALKQMDLEDVVIKIIYPFQNKIGVLWVTDHVIPAQEHFTSNIIRQKITVAIDRLPMVKNTRKKEIALFTPESEQHEIPLQFIYYLLKKNDNKVIYFGSNVSLDSLELYQQNRPFNFMLFHLVTNLTSIPANTYIKQLSARFANKQIFMSGSLVKQVTELQANVHLLTSVEEVLQFATE